MLYIFLTDETLNNDEKIDLIKRLESKDLKIKQIESFKKNIEDDLKLKTESLLLINNEKNDLQAELVTHKKNKKNSEKEQNQKVLAFQNEKVKLKKTKKKITNINVLLLFIIIISGTYNILNVTNHKSNKRIPTYQQNSNTYEINENTNIDSLSDIPINQENENKSLISSKKESVIKDSIYIVKDGDSFWRIQELYGVAMERIAKNNNLSIASTIKPGDTLRIPIESLKNN